VTPPRRRRASDDEPLLFDLPLDAPDRGPARMPRPAAQATQPPLFRDEPLAHDTDAEEEAALPDLEAEPIEDVRSGPVVAGIPSRLFAGCADALLHVGVVAGVYLGLIALEVEPRIEHWPAFVTLLVAFSFLSSVVSLAFWGQTAGMAWRGLQSRDRLQRPLTFRQASLRWAGGLLTFATAGLPLLFALGGASLTDWLSRSVTYQLPDAAASQR